MDNTFQTFFSLLRAGLWSRDERIDTSDNVNWADVYRLAQEQTVVGLIAEGMEHIPDVRIPQYIALLIAADVLQMEKRNKEMNDFVERLIAYLRKRDVYVILVKGQGIAQCYKRPLWRSCGDVDLLLNQKNYENGKKALLPLASNVDKEVVYRSHLEMIIDGWSVELHGSMRGDMWSRINHLIDDAQRNVFNGGDVRSWMNGKTLVFLSGINSDIIFVFTHILQHFFDGGIGLRQVCDWCRLLWTYKDEVNEKQLKCQIKKAGLMTEWMSFASLAVNWLGMPSEAMPLYSSSEKWSRKGNRIISYMMETGNMGHNRDKSYIAKKSYFLRKLISLHRNNMDTIRRLMIFPLDSIRMWLQMLSRGMMMTSKGD